MLPPTVMRLTHKANQFLDACQYVEAIKFYKQCFKIKPKHVEALVNISTCYLHLGLPEMSLYFIEKALELEQNCIVTYTNYAASLIHLGKIDEAMKTLETALFEANLDEANHPMAYNNLGCAYGQKGDHDNAIFYYEIAIKCDWGDECTLARVNLGNVLYRKFNDKEAAFEHYEYAASVGNVEAQALLHQYPGPWCN